MFYVISAVGADRVGLADDIATFMSDRLINIEESKMAVLGGEFAVIMLVSMKAAANTFEQEILDFAQKNSLHLEVKSTSGPRSEASGRPYEIESLSLDTPGIVHSITSLLKQFFINIEDLETETSSAPWTGAPMFRMRGRITIPGDVKIADVREKLDELAHQQDLDITLNAITAGGSGLT